MTFSTSKEEYQSIVSRMDDKIDEYKNETLTLTLTQLMDDTKKELSYWKNVGLHPTYVNTTLLHIDGQDMYGMIYPLYHMILYNNGKMIL